MAREIVIRMTDDLDRTLVAEHTRDLTFESIVYTLDLNDEHLEQLRADLQPWLDAAHERRKQGSKKPLPKSAPSPIDNKAHRTAIREWARAEGHEVGDKGIIAAHILEAYNNRSQHGRKRA